MPDLESFDPDDLNEDWLKTRTWDVWVWSDGGPQLVTTLSQLLAVNGWSEDDLETRERVQHLTTLPSWVPAPAQLKREVEAYLSD